MAGFAIKGRPIAVAVLAPALEGDQVELYHDARMPRLEALLLLQRTLTVELLALANPAAVETQAPRLVEIPE